MTVTLETPAGQIRIFPGTGDGGRLVYRMTLREGVVADFRDPKVAEAFANCFAILDEAEDLIRSGTPITIRDSIVLSRKAWSVVQSRIAKIHELWSARQLH